MQDTQVEAGVQLAAAGYVVFPALRTRERGPGCKVPPGGFLWRGAGARSAAEARALAARYPAADGWAVDCGASEIVVVDLDPGHDPEPWRAFEARDATPRGEHVLLAEVRTAVVGNGDERRHGMAGVDVKGLGGYVIAYGPLPPRDQLPACPGWLVEKMRATRDPGVRVELQLQDQNTRAVGASTRVDPFGGPARSFTREEAGRYVRAALDRLEAARPGWRNNTLNDVAMTIGHFVPAFWDEATVTEQLATRAAAIGLSYGEARGTIRSGLAAGMREAYERAETADGTEGSQEGDAREGASDKPKTLFEEALSWEEMSNRPNPEPLIVGLLDLNTISWLIGKSGSYKTFVALDWAAHVGNGMPWLGRRVQQGEVFYVVAEGDSGMPLRTRAYSKRRGSVDNVFLLPRPVQAKSKEWDRLVAEAGVRRPRLIVLDTQARVTVGMEENSNTEMGLFVDQLERLRKASGACVLVVHHIGRNGTDARGASSIDGAQGTELRVEKTDRLRAMVHMDKQKDMDETDGIVVGFEVVDLGIDPATSRPLSSLVALDDQFIAPLMIEPEWIANATENQTRVIAVAADHFATRGGTKAEIRVTLIERFGPMARTSFNRAWDSLVHKEILVRVAGTQRYGLASMLGGGRQDGQEGTKSP